MRIIEEKAIIEEVKKLFISANTDISCDITDSLKEARKKETSELTRSVIDVIIKNNEIAEKDKLPICQDTGMAILFIKIGNDVVISGRSKGEVNVQLILEKLQGGGHFDIAGAQVKNANLTRTCEMLKSAIDDYFEYDHQD